MNTFLFLVACVLGIMAIYLILDFIAFNIAAYRAVTTKQYDKWLSEDHRMRPGSGFRLLKLFSKNKSIEIRDDFKQTPANTLEASGEGFNKWGEKDN